MTKRDREYECRYQALHCRSAAWELVYEIEGLLERGTELDEKLVQLAKRMRERLEAHRRAWKAIED